jgi:hypothetical protein
VSDAGEDQTAGAALPMPAGALAAAAGLSAELLDLRAALSAAIAAEQGRLAPSRRARSLTGRGSPGRKGTGTRGAKPPKP